MYVLYPRWERIWTCAANKINQNANSTLVNRILYQNQPQKSASLIVQGLRMTEIPMAKPICGRAASRNLQDLVAANFWAATPHGVLVSVHGLNEHSAPVLAANRLRTAPHYFETRRPCSAPVIVVQSNAKVTQTERIHLRTTINGAFAAMGLNHSKTVRPCLT